MLNKQKDLLLKTILYSDIFDYPLTKIEIWKYLIDENQESRIQNQESFFKHIPQEIQQKAGFYFLKNRDFLIELRQKREKVSRRKIEIAKTAVKLLSVIPTIQFIGVSGNVAMLNADSQDDIDLFIITKKSTVWSTRLAATLLTDMVGMRRKKRDKNVADKVCLNYFINETSLTIQTQDLYSAHEVAQVLPIFDRNSTYEKFLQANKWVNKFLPNAFLVQSQTVNIKGTFPNIFPSFFSNYYKFLEPLARFFQKLHMEKPAKNETITKNILAFHPEDYRGKVLKLYEKKLTDFKL